MRLCVCDPLCYSEENPEENEPTCWTVHQIFMEDPCADQIEISNQLDLSCMYRLSLVAEQRIIKLSVLVA